MLNKTYECSQLEFYIKFFQILNIIQSSEELKLQKQEILILSHLLLLVDNDYKTKRFKLPGQIQVRNILQISNANVKTTLSKLVKKKYLYLDDNGDKQLSPKLKQILDNAIETKDFSIVFKFKIHE